MRYLITLSLTVFMSSCEIKKIDLNKINLNTSVNKNKELNFFDSYKNVQKGHYEIQKNNASSEINDINSDISLKLINSGEVVNNYIIDNDKGLFIYDQINIDSKEIKLSDFNNKICYISFGIQNRYDEFYNFLTKKLKKPFHIQNTNSPINSNIDEKGAQLLKKTFSSLVKEQENTFNEKTVTYPERIYWYENNYFYVLTINVSNNIIFTDFDQISKDAINKKIVLGYHNALNDSIYKSIFNKNE